MFQINLENIYRSNVGAEETVQLEGQLKLPDHTAKELLSVTSEVKLARVNEGISLAFRSESKFPTHCDRCLNNFEHKLKNEFDHYLDNNQIIHLKDYQFNTEPLFSENFILNVPIQKLCKANCLGLCQHCGINRNLEKCNCEIDNKNNPFKVLKKEVNGATKEKDLEN